MTTWRMRIATWIHQAINTHSEHAILGAFLRNNGCTNAFQCYFVRILQPVLFLFIRNVMYTFRFEMNLLITRRCRGSGCCRWSLTSEVHVLYRVSPREICGAQSDSGEGFYSSTSIPSVSIIPKMLHRRHEST